jgi:sugar/nucleoside kinase (ribokinase family)
VTPHVSYKEVVRSDTAKRKGIKNIPDKKQLASIRILCRKVFEPVREHFGVPIFISSCFRSPKLNKAIGGAKNSQHLANNGAAMDLDADIFGKVTNTEIGDYIRENLDFDQLIYEDWQKDDYAWIHVSFNLAKNRNQTLVMERKKGKVTYKPYS